MFSNISFVDHAFSLQQTKFTTFLCVLYYLYINMLEYCCSINSTLLYVQDRVTRIGNKNKDEYSKDFLSMIYFESMISVSNYKNI